MPTSQHHDTADVVQLLPPHIPALILGNGRQSYSYPARSPSPSPASHAPSFWRQQQQSGQHQQQQPDQLLLQQSQQPQHIASRSSSTNSSVRRVPTASGSAPGPAASSNRPAKAPIDILWRAIAGGGVGAGAGGMFCGPSNALQLRLWPLPGMGGRSAACPAKKQKTVLIMMSNTGGGHKASAEALKQAFEEKYGDKYRVLIVDMWEQHTPYPFNQLPNSYSFMVQHGFLWRLCYTTLNPPALHLPYMNTIHMFVAKQLSQAFDHYDPDLVVSVHPLMQHIPARVLAARAKRLGRAAPCPLATVVTDFTTCHNTWFCRKVNKCFVPTEFCRQLGLKMGLSPEQLVLYGLPIRPIFSKKLPSQSALRKKLGLLPGVPAILLVGGGEGMGKLKATVEQLDLKLQGAAQVVVICGRNKKLLADLKSTQWPGGSHVVPCGFVDNIHEWMAAVDTIITKAGPGTIAEALISGLPILLNGNVPCQEEGNIPYVVDNGVGTFETNPAKIADIMADWLAPENKVEFKHMAARSAALGRPQAVYQIVHDLAEMANELGAAARRLTVTATGGKEGQLLPVGRMAAT